MGRKKEFKGVVLSNKMKKTIVVRVDRISKHPFYNRMQKHSSKYKVHDETNSANVGDIVWIQETRPLSKEKNFRLKEIVKKAETVIEIKDEVAA
ncbi:MAG: 30S ribosomal protein S17 [Candidatus Omnitrophica bacterium]|nr:30S ribosomal protein S17 [Candidatus Omnitrophota bacterium]